MTTITRLDTPWGPAQTITELAPGVRIVTTASHGGLQIEEPQWLELPAAVRRTFTRLHSKGWAEEDCEMAIALVLLGLAEHAYFGGAQSKVRRAALGIANFYETYHPCREPLDQCKPIAGGSEEEACAHRHLLSLWCPDCGQTMHRTIAAVVRCRPCRQADGLGHARVTQVERARTRALKPIAGGSGEASCIGRSRCIKADAGEHCRAHDTGKPWSLIDGCHGAYCHCSERTERTEEAWDAQLRQQASAPVLAVAREHDASPAQTPYHCEELAAREQELYHCTTRELEKLCLEMHIPAPDATRRAHPDRARLRHSQRTAHPDRPGEGARLPRGLQDHRRRAADRRRERRDGHHAYHIHAQLQLRRDIPRLRPPRRGPAVGPPPHRGAAPSRPRPRALARIPALRPRDRHHGPLLRSPRRQRRAGQGQQPSRTGSGSTNPKSTPPPPTSPKCGT